ncbi:hypothetical protein PUR59_00525 [Streptomyces sp. SP18ES09]|uniref:hypothetical protein n=1 Tax=Streptomyces sp. SP18ES09 TaxID=3002532 RepID=UPI002E7854C7|nr:hypothetical protein [Streptomyces sp. SP18ES09]MEE1813536.1 hypothetical protein [Streptomyces sp. SP18ES09]
MKDSYKATWGGKAALLRDIKPGVSLFVINEHAPITDARYAGIDAGPGRTYSEWIVTSKRSPLIGSVMAQSPTHHGYICVDSLLAKERQIYTRRPDLPLLGAPEAADAYTSGARRAERMAAEQFARERSEDMSRQWAHAGR